MKLISALSIFAIISPALAHQLNGLDDSDDTLVHRVARAVVPTVTATKTVTATVTATPTMPPIVVPDFYLPLPPPYIDQTHANYKQVQRFWDNFMYPKNRDVVNLGDPNKILAATVKGSVDITRNFNGSELNIEYLFGTFGGFIDDTQFAFVPRPINYTITAFATSGNTASTSVIVTLQDPHLGTISELQIDSWTQYDQAGSIQQYDAIFRRYPFFLADLVQRNGPVMLQLYKQLTNTTLTASAQNYGLALQTLLANSICQTHTKSCTGANSQYASQAACFTFLTTQTPLGEAWQAGQNDVLCRAIHQQMVPIRPAEHCPHIGPTGGGMCINTPYSDVFLPFFNHSWNPLA
ncbi:hypothetical protein HKX48_000364 [Thoreauomyces humboldtii]|nr:hypothetical protein HKX48_000364 [Thoreauomyces humboldtii]